MAAAIVRFVAGGAELANAEVEPALLSLICRELNDARLAQGQSEISLDLLAGSHASILTHFYERSLADQPEAVRRIIEDDLLTESGFRENVAEESLLKRFETAGAPPGALATLVNRRVLRIEERLDVRRVELIHDVLCAVVKASRDQRHEREAREAAERVLADQRTRERAARHALQRARAVAIGCILLAALALSAAVFAYISAQRARQAERMAQQSRAVAEQARNHSEELLGYLSDDFERELESFGQLKIIAQFTQREIDYFHALPSGLRSAETVRNGALALIGHALALGHLGHYDAGIQETGEAIRLLEGLRRQGDRSEPTLVALGRAHLALCYINAGGVGPRLGLEDCDRAAALLQPLADRPGASVAARRAYLETLSDIGWLTELGDAPENERALQATRQAMQIASGLGARDLGDLGISADYTEAGAWQVTALLNLGRNEEALRVGRELLAVADRILALRPWYRSVLHAKAVTEVDLASAADDELDPREMMRFALESRQMGLAFLRLDPNNLPSQTNLGLALLGLGESLWASGRLDEGIEWYRKALDRLTKQA
ncbi:MAG: hypothetical protein KGJ72_17180, partial [Gammaproteobacteria bacterium]|nr:hypothetical protein [Gammaproteobacteria bacterium]